MIVVTGAAGILGQAALRRLGTERPGVIAVDMSPEIPEIGQIRSFGGVDLGSEASCQKLVTTLADMTGGTLQGLVNIAGGFSWETMSEGSWQTWERMLRLNLQLAHHMTFYCLPLLRRAQGAIVNIGAAAAFYRSGAGMGPYAASKAAVGRMTESLAAEEIRNGVRVNAVLPTIMDTPANRRDMPDADFSTWATPDEVAEVIAFLLSSSASGVTGASIVVNGRIQP